METVFFITSKLVWTLLQPGNLLLCVLLLGVLALWRKRYRLANYCMTGALISLVSIALLPLDDWILYPLETRYPIPDTLPEQVDGIIVLGGAEMLVSSAAWQQVQLNTHAERVTAGVQLAKRYPDAKLVYSSGSGSVLQQELSGAILVAPLIRELGIGEDQLMLETQSRNTYENVVNLKALLSPDATQHWILVTSAGHMPRSVALFDAQNWPVIPYPVDFISLPSQACVWDFNLATRLERFEYAVHEWIGLLAYRMTGKIKHL